ncbi:hypothetical protein AVEN_156299-1 [Araneus ventricosus]|uniref:Uncharacterized protein n=1 Tax=Araneus ventricosus TaxID=182803 RepID=A0A4Y2S0Z4_ARAVE|nr:hypothetical protein AVEN_5739-1 [Araneus ventricosus]GBN71294.1 hypothetical protein AVEN_108426-1 [Araneus ventricosus]GBN80844.1 hypothetical protein AVEN_221794-1 [Araneus ventricosus]GBN80870.1 hypothetical protein AVEN_156299-1 [Araneus ventricosus]
MGHLKSCSDCVWLGLSRFLLVDCGQWNSEKLRRSDGAWLGKSLCNTRVNGCNDAVWPLLPPLICVIFTATTREQQMHLIAHESYQFFLFIRRGITQNSWKDRP